jgi:hypothetical protein
MAKTILIRKVETENSLHVYMYRIVPHVDSIYVHVPGMVTTFVVVRHG